MADEATRAIVAGLETNTEAIRRLTEESREEVALLREQSSLVREQSSLLHGQTTVLERQAAVLRQLAKSIADMRDESRAHTQALLRVLDRLDGPEPGSAAT